MVPVLSCDQCGWRATDSAEEAAIACPKCGVILKAVSNDDSTIAWAPPGEIPRGPLAGEDAETEFIIGEPEKSDGGKKTTVVDFVTPAEGEIAPPGVEERLPAVEESGNASVAESGVAVGAAPVTDNFSTASLPASPSPALEPHPSGRAGDVSRPEGVIVSPLKLKLLLSYASALTLACLYLLYLVWKGGPSLDLPDLAPPVTKANRVTTLLYVPPDQVIPPAHQLQLGESKRYGSLRVRAVKVTRGPLSFSYFDPEVKETRSDSGPVLKLHLQLENASGDQEFIPLDRQLVFTKEPDKKRFGGFKANNFLCNVAQRADLDEHVLVYDLPPDSSWIVQGENLDRELKPGEAVEVFIPTTEEGWEGLEGDLVWRVHLRKGYNRRSLRGVTTLVEVRFRSSDIVDERTAAPGSDV